jgi:hypothetical protein
MPSFRKLYCEQNQCAPDVFERRVFWHCLYPHARLLAPFISLFDRNFFSADRSLITRVADAETMALVREEVRDYFWDSNNRGWLRRTVNIRVSGQRVKNLARRYLPEGTSNPPFFR